MFRVHLRAAKETMFRVQTLRIFCCFGLHNESHQGLICKKVALKSREH